MVTVIDYGVGNLFSLESSFSYIGEKVKVTGDPEEISKAEKLVLPGVGAFRDAAEKLKNSGIEEIVKEKAGKGVPIMGICLGMQLLFDKSSEFGNYKGLGLIKGSVEPIKEVIGAKLKIPHIGWNALKFPNGKHPVFRYINEGDYVYFVHSYYAKAAKKENVIATTEYGTEITAAAADKNVMGCQFHPEKSGKVGLEILKGFCEWEGEE